MVPGKWLNLFHCHDLYCNLYYELKINLFNISLKCIKYKYTVLCYIMHLQVDIQMWEISVFMKEWPSYPTGGSPVYAILQHFYFIYMLYENMTFILSSLTNVLSIRECTKPSLVFTRLLAQAFAPMTWQCHLKLCICSSICICFSESCLPLSKHVE